MEDYGITAFWSSSKGNLLCSERVTFQSLVIAGCISPFRKGCTVSLKTDGLVQLDEDLRIIREIPNIKLERICYGGGEHVLMGIEDGSLRIIDMRSPDWRVAKESHKSPFNTLSSMGENGKIMIDGKDSLLLYDMRFLPGPVIEYDHSYLWHGESKWIDWLGEGKAIGMTRIMVCFVDQLLVYGKSNIDTLTLMSNVGSGHPLVDTSIVEDSPLGISADSDKGRIFILLRDGTVMSFTADEFTKVESIEIPKEPCETNHQIRLTMSHDEELSGTTYSCVESCHIILDIYNYRFRVQNPHRISKGHSVDLVDLVDLDSLTPACKHLLREWIIDDI